MNKIFYIQIYVLSFFYITNVRASEIIETDVVQTTIPATQNFKLDYSPSLIAVQQSIYHEFVVNSDFQEIAPDILRMNHLMYLIGKSNDPNTRYKFNDQNWEDPRIVEGKTGHTTILSIEKSFDDYVALITYHKTKNIIAIVFRGSRNIADWKTNFSGFFGLLKTQQARSLGFNFDGDFHPGFLEKYKSCKSNLEEILDQYFKKLPHEKISSLRVIVNGHSQGGGLAMIASLDLLTDFFKRKYGSSFINSEKNLLYGWYISAPKISNPDFINEIVGKDNIIFQTVLLDFATKIGFEKLPEKTLNVSADLLSSFLGFSPSKPNYIELTIDNYGRSISQYFLKTTTTPGHLAIDYTLETVHKGYELSMKDYYRKTWKRGDSPHGLLWNIVYPNIPLYYDTACSLIAPTHYGTTVNGRGGAFDAELVLNNSFQKTLTQGYYYSINQPLPSEFVRENNFNNTEESNSYLSKFTTYLSLNFHSVRGVLALPARSITLQEPDQTMPGYIISAQKSMNESMKRLYIQAVWNNPKLSLLALTTYSFYNWNRKTDRVKDFRPEF